jgi:hypothetical protein
MVAERAASPAAKSPSATPARQVTSVPVAVLRVAVTVATTLAASASSPPK